ncbi:hypothetical protein LXL04_004311 [Taraxacum kok-saghyz]
MVETDKENLWLTTKFSNKKFQERPCRCARLTVMRNVENNIILANETGPLETWSYLEAVDLQIFRQRISTKEFQILLDFSVKSEKVKAGSQHNTNSAKIGPHGYEGHKFKWE